MKIGVDDYDTRVEESERWTGGYASRRGKGVSGAPVRRKRGFFADPPEPADGELYVYPYSTRDSMFGTRQFFLYWRAWLQRDVVAGRPDGCYGTRGQVFHADDRTYIREHLAAGQRVFWWPTGEEVTLGELAEAAPPHLRRAGTS